MVPVGVGVTVEDFAAAGYTRIALPAQLGEEPVGQRSARGGEAREFGEVPEGVRVRIAFDAETTHPAEQQRQGWQAILDNFARHVEARG